MMRKAKQSEPKTLNSLNLILQKTAYEVGRFFGKSQKTINQTIEIGENISELIQQVLTFYGFTAYSSYLLRQSSSDKSLPSI